MKPCTCPDCGGELLITCERRCERAALGATVTDTPPAIRAAREPGPRVDERRARTREPNRLRAGSVASLLWAAMADRAIWTTDRLWERVQVDRADATRPNVNVSLSHFVSAGRIQRVARGQYRRAA
jgi:hypothetical protein